MMRLKNTSESSPFNPSSRNGICLGAIKITDDFLIAYQLTDCLVRAAHVYVNVSREGVGKRKGKADPEHPGGAGRELKSPLPKQWIFLFEAFFPA